ncbi:MAG: DUF4430 domain-containing protein [Lachnospiraceae bacterium]|nr:DUF4430 domain-containing protein [Lachnospiraceae bacterium]
MIIILCGSVKTSAKDNSYVKTCREYTDGIIEHEMSLTGTDSIEAWISKALAEDIGGTAEWYMLGLLQYPYASGKEAAGIEKGAGKYRSALENYVASKDIKGGSVRLKFALLLIASGSDSAFISEVLDDGTIGSQGIMSYVFGLHILNNGYESDSISLENLLTNLMEKQHEDGGWSISGGYGDVDVTAMTLTALAPYSDPETCKQRGLDADLISESISAGINFLSEKQLEDGDYQSYGARNAESTAQVITALSALGIDCAGDSRFIKNGNTPIDGLSLYRKNNGSFSHKLDDSENATATVQTFYSLVAYERFASGKGSLFLIKNPAVKDGEIEDSGEIPGTKETGGITEEGKAEETKEIPETGETEESEESEKTEETVGITEEGETEETKEIPEAGETEDTGEIPEIEENEETGKTGKTQETGKTRETDKAKMSAKAENNGNKPLGYKLYAIIAILAVSAFVCALLALLKKHRKNILFTLIVTAAAILFVIFTDFASTKDYYGGAERNNYSPDGMINVQNDNVPDPEADGIKVDISSCKVSMSIRCDIIKDRTDNKYIPADGCILDDTDFEIHDGDTAYDVLVRAAREYGISVDHKGSGEMIYISGINYLYELDYGDLSGWVYKVNGKLPSVGCAAYKLEPQDRVEWCYTLDLGNDTFGN